MPRAVKATRPPEPIFGVDTEEVETLRQLAAILRQYRMYDEVSLNDVYEVLDKVTKIQRATRRKN